MTGRLLFFLVCLFVAFSAAFALYVICAFLFSESTEDQDVERVPAYDRRYFGGWIDADGDCLDTRDEVLKLRSTSSPELDSERCDVETGTWNDYYTGSQLTEASSIDIDHLVPLKYAWEMGAHTWTDQARRVFTNDPDNLVITTSSINRRKGALGPTNWLPPSPTKSCNYITQFIGVLEKYRLQVIDALGSLEQDICSTGLAVVLAKEGLNNSHFFE